MRIRRLRTALASWIVLVTVVQCSFAPDDPGKALYQFEPIRSDYTNLRGMNYIPSYAGSSVGVWNLYDPELVARELRHTRRLGANSVRVWLSYWSWHHEPDEFLESFRHLLDTCESLGLFLIPVLWDSCFTENAVTDSPWLVLDTWIPCPGQDFLRQPETWDRFDPFVEAIVTEARSSPALLIWDVMNEPVGDGTEPWLRRQIEHVRELDPDHPITIGWTGPPPVTEAGKLVDVVSYHPYGVFRENVRVRTRQAREHAEQIGGKPIIATEIGAPGWLARYEDVLRYLQEENVGFMLFESIIHTHPKYPFRGPQGILYSDGETRDPVGVMAFQEVTKRQGGPFDPDFAVKSKEDPLYFPYAPVNNGMGGPELVDLMFHWDERYGTPEYPQISPEHYGLYLAVLNQVVYGLGLSDLMPDELAGLRRSIALYSGLAGQGDFEAAEEVLVGVAREAAQLMDNAEIGPQ